MAVKPDSITISAYLNSSWVDLSSDVLGRGGLSANWGIKGNGPLDIIADIGNLKLTLWNYSQEYYPDGSSPLSGWNWRVPIRVVIVYGAYTRTLRYYLDTINPRVKKSRVDDDVEITALDWLAFAEKYPILAPSIETDKTADYGLTTITTAMTPAPQATDFDTGNYILPTIFDGVGMKTTAYSEIVKLAMSEFGPLYLEKDSVYGETLRFENLTARNSGTIAATFDVDEDLDVGNIELRYGENIVNRAKAIAYPKRIDKELQVLYSLGEAMPIKAGETIEFRAKYTDPEGGGTRVNAIVSTMQTPAAPGDPDATLMTLLNFPYANIEYVIDDTSRHTWVRNDVAPLNDVYYDVSAQVTRITSGVLGPYALFGGYSNYKMTAPSSTDFDLFQTGTPCTIGWYEDRLTNAADKASFTRDLDASFPPYVVKTDATDMLVYMSSDGVTWDVANGKTFGKLTRNRWVYYEINYDGTGWFYLFTDGKKITEWYSTTSLPASSGTFSIGCWNTSQYTFMGLDSFFVRKGEMLHNTDFEPPRRQYNATYDGDYRMNTAENGTGTDISDQLTITATYDSVSVNYQLTNDSEQDAFIIHLQARGKGVYPYNEIEYAAEDSTSITNYGYKEITLSQPYQTNLTAGKSIVTSFVANEKDPRTQLTSVSYHANRSAARMQDFLTLDVGDLIRVADDSSGIDNYYHIQNVDFSIKRGSEIYVTYELRSAYVIDPDFGGGGGGSGTDDGTIGVGGPLGGAQRGAVVRVYAGNVGLAQVHEITVDSAYVEVYSGSCDEITIDTITVDSAYVTVHCAEVGIPGYVEQHNLLSEQHLDTTDSDPVLGGVVVAKGSPLKWEQLAGNTTTTRKFFRQTGTGAVSASPEWDTLLAGDIPDISATYVPKALFDANTILYATTDNTPVALTLAANTFPARSSSGAIAAKSVTDFALTLLDDTTAAAACTTLGLGTANNPQFNTIELGHASDTTLARVSAGVMSVEGKSVYMAGGTDVAVADGGTGASTAATGFDNLKQAATSSYTGVVELATAAEVTTGTDTTRAITPSAFAGSVYATQRICKTVINPQIVYGIDTQIIIFRTPAAITITRIHISGNDPTPTSELDIDLKWADDTTAWTNAAVIDVCDTSSGVKTITSGFDDATVPSGKYIYWQFGAEPHEDWTQFYFEIYFTYD